MGNLNKMWFSLAVVLLAVWACLADAAIQSASRPAAHRSKRMVGGTLAPHVPWQAMVYLGESIMDGGYAGGALISDRWVLTAGRNLFVRKRREYNRGKNPLIPKVYLGITGKAEAVPSKEVAVQKVVLHPGFQNHTDCDNDLALIQLKDPVSISDKITPIPLPEAGQDLVGSGQGLGVIAGWGWGALLSYATSLKHLVVPISTYGNCKLLCSGAPTPEEDESMFCTQGTALRENVCTGDSGGALAVRDPNSGEVYAAGILSYDKPCSTENYAVYMKISAYLPWIHSVMRGDTESSSALRSKVMSEMLSR